jgi:hypothetical protein
MEHSKIDRPTGLSVVVHGTVLMVTPLSLHLYNVKSVRYIQEQQYYFSESNKDTAHKHKKSFVMTRNKGQEGTSRGRRPSAVSDTAICEAWQLDLDVNLNDQLDPLPLTECGLTLKHARKRKRREFASLVKSLVVQIPKKN